MSIPLHCPSCRELVGVDDNLFAKTYRDSLIAEIACHGKGKHQPPVRTIERKLFGLVERVTVKYPETYTSSWWNEYVGPKRRFYVWLAIMLGGNDGIIINGKSCWWDLKLGFYGDGVEEFQ